jgi:hypothetical protein
MLVLSGMLTPPPRPKYHPLGRACADAAIAANAKTLALNVNPRRSMRASISNAIWAHRGLYIVRNWPDLERKSNKSVHAMAYTP